ncbi:cytochrome b561 [Candidatus Pantoea multigeneris]|uniref:Cytochrome b561 n=1 Tax=Candidatus Pantoea multigeneris TaxID=2608357 RepID=A0ABX0RCL2_9GAMM|nr:cytochrome b561 [Pantoea multigeneris]NIF22046.1 cytochrome b561 [Pantoea multigeneris]
MRTNKYASSQITLHWLTFLLVVVAYYTMEFRGFAQRGSTLGFTLIITHFSAGTTVLVLMLLRLVQRLRHRTPAIEPKPPAWQTGMAHLTHLAIYLLFIILPVLGLSSRYLRGRDWWLFGIQMPVASEPNFELVDSLVSWHETLATAGYWLIGLHAAAALFHHYVMKDNVLLRMMPSKRKG